MTEVRRETSAVVSLGGGAFVFLLLLVLLWRLGEEGGSSEFGGERRARRIVSLAPSVTEILFGLGLDAEVVGVTDFCDYPARAKGRPKVGGFKGKSLEAIVALSPDVVIGTRDGNEEGLLQTLNRLHIPLLTVQPRTLSEVIWSVRRIGEAVGRKESAEELARFCEGRLSEVQARVGGAHRFRVLLVYGREPLVLAGPGTFADDLIRLAGGENVTGDAGVPYPRFSLETVLARAPEVIVEGAMGSEGVDEKARSAISFWSRFPSLPAVREGRIVAIPENLIARPGPRLFDGLLQLARALHPECFPAGVGGSAKGGKEKS